MNTSRQLGAICACLLLVTVTTANASVIYEYTGQDFTNNFNGGSTPIGYNPTGAFALRLELANPLDPNESGSSLYTGEDTLDLLSFSYFDGAEWRGFGSTYSISLWADGTGGIQLWDIIFTVSHDPALAGDKTSYWRSINYVSKADATWTSLCTADDGTGCTGGELIRSGSNQNKPGVWSMSAVPVPAAAWLFGAGLLGLVGVARRKKVVQ